MVVEYDDEVEDINFDDLRIGCDLPDSHMSG
jgi:hypothetical protein